VEPHYRLVRYTEMPRGGHFAALEQPELYARDVAEFFTDLGQ
jgi:pimeloyl-ACP methyl ester carboxylesterase